jgi:hypothetical protein
LTTLMAHVQLGRPNRKLLKLTSDLADRLNATVIGIAVYRLHRFPYGDDYVGGVERNPGELEREIGDAETEFRAALQKHSGKVKWRSAAMFTALADYLAEQARSADLVISGIDRSGKPFDSSRDVNIGDLVMQLGRPALIVPPSEGTANLGRVLIGWSYH